MQPTKGYDDGATFAMSFDAAVSTSDVIEWEGAFDDRTYLARSAQVREVGREVRVHVFYQHMGANPTETPQLSETEQH